MLLHTYQVFSSLVGDLHFLVHFFFNFMEYFFFGHPILRETRNAADLYDSNHLQSFSFYDIISTFRFVTTTSFFHFLVLFLEFRESFRSGLRKGLVKKKEKKRESWAVHLLFVFVVSFEKHA